jgi:hypothetical protein
MRAQIRRTVGLARPEFRGNVPRKSEGAISSHDEPPRNPVRVPRKFAASLATERQLFCNRVNFDRLDVAL